MIAKTDFSEACHPSSLKTIRSGTGQNYGVIGALILLVGGVALTVYVIMTTCSLRPLIRSWIRREE